MFKKTLVSVSKLFHRILFIRLIRNNKNKKNFVLFKIVYLIETIQVNYSNAKPTEFKVLYQQYIYQI